MVYENKIFRSARHWRFTVPQLLIRLISKLTMHKEKPILSLMLQISR